MERAGMDDGAHLSTYVRRYMRHYLTYATERASSLYLYFLHIFSVALSGILERICPAISTACDVTNLYPYLH